jgi:hypothetical protein
MQWRRIVGDRNDPLRKEIWTIATTDMHGMSGNRQTLDLEMVGGAGSARSWTTWVPNNRGAGQVKVAVHVQFSGSNVTLSFTKV